MISAQLFYDFCIEEHVPTDHLLRRIDQFLDLEDLRTKQLRATEGEPNVGADGCGF